MPVDTNPACSTDNPVNKKDLRSTPRQVSVFHFSHILTCGRNSVALGNQLPPLTFPFSEILKY